MFKKKYAVNKPTMRVLCGLFGLCIFVSSLGGAAFFGYSLSELNKDLNPTSIQPSHYSNLDIYNNSDSICIKDAYVGTAVGASMQNAIWAGNSPLMMYVHGTDIEYKEGWIVVARLPNNDTIAHRIRGVYPDYVVTQGDTNKEYEIIPKSYIIGVIVGVLFT